MNFISKCVVGFLASLCIASSSLAQDLYGEWSGSIMQTSPEKTYPARMILDGVQGRMDYLSLGCGGLLIFRNRNADTYYFTERLTYGRTKCIDGGSVAVRASGTSVDWTWNGSGATASGTLTGIRRAP